MSEDRYNDYRVGPDYRSAAPGEYEGMGPIDIYNRGDGHAGQVKQPRTAMKSSSGAADMRVTRDDEMKWDERPYDLVDWEAEAKMHCCWRFWRAKWNLKPRGPVWLPEIIRMTW